MHFFIILLLEAILFDFLISKLFRLSFEDTLWLIFLSLIMVPSGVGLLGGYLNIKSRFMKRHNLVDSEF
jgi:hypothetical protein